MSTTDAAAGDPRTNGHFLQSCFVMLTSASCRTVKSPCSREGASVWMAHTLLPSTITGLAARGPIATAWFFFGREGGADARASRAQDTMSQRS